MSVSELRSKSLEDLKKEILELRKEQFNLRMQKATGQLSNPSRFKLIRREIAQIKTIMTEQQRAQSKA